MLHITVEEFSNDTASLLRQVLQTEAPLRVDTKDGSVVVLPEQRYHALLATWELSAPEALRQKITEGRATPLSDCLPEESVPW